MHVYDQTGKIVNSNLIYNIKVSFDLSHLVKGIYQIKISDSNGNYDTHRVVKK